MNTKRLVTNTLTHKSFVGIKITSALLKDCKKSQTNKQNNWTAIQFFGLPEMHKQNLYEYSNGNTLSAATKHPQAIVSENNYIKIMNTNLVKQTATSSSLSVIIL